VVTGHWSAALQGFECLLGAGGPAGGGAFFEYDCCVGRDRSRLGRDKRPEEFGRPVAAVLRAVWDRHMLIRSGSHDVVVVDNTNNYVLV
jgi:hypothetical protein